MAIYSYKITRDYGFAPNPFYGVCSLATCKPKIRERAKVGDWVLGFGSSSAKSKYKNKLIYAMKVDEKLTLDEYWRDKRFKCKRPVPNGSLKQNYGDNIYHLENGKWIQEDSHHSLEKGVVNTQNLDKDTGGIYVLLGRKYWYFGKSAIEVPIEFSELLPHIHDREYRKSLMDAQNFEEWLESLEEKGYIDEPDKFDKEFERYNGK